jgi:hypothetical protein
MKKKIGDAVYCINELVYSEHISKRQEYFILDVKEDQFRIKSKKDKLIWLPATCFADELPPSIIKVTFDDEITNENNDCIEVTVEFDDNKKCWLTFITIEYLAKLLSDHQEYLTGRDLIFVKSLDREIIEKAIQDLDIKNELLKEAKRYVDMTSQNKIT